MYLLEKLMFKTTNESLNKKMLKFTQQFCCLYNIK